MSYKFNTISVETGDDQIVILTVNRPEKLNALNREVLDELNSAVENFNSDINVSAVIITGAGEKAFVAGADIKELSDLDEDSGKQLSTKGQKIFSAIENSEKPYIAAINGYALGGGAELAMACHIRVGNNNAVIGLPETSLGLIPGYGGTQRLTRLVGRAKALEMILTASHVKADEALRIGLLNRLSEEASPVEEARKLASKMLKNGPVALARAIRAVNSVHDNTGYQAEAALFGELCSTHDFREGTTAFLEKRKPEFRGA